VINIYALMIELSLFRNRLLAYLEHINEIDD